MPIRTLPDPDYAAKLDRQLAQSNHLRALQPTMFEFVYGFIPRRPLAETAAENQQRHDAARKAHQKLPRLA